MNATTKISLITTLVSFLLFALMLFFYLTEYKGVELRWFDGLWIFFIYSLVFYPLHRYALAGRLTKEE